MTAETPDALEAPRRCPHYDGEIVGPVLPDPLPYAAVRCVRCGGVWVRSPYRMPEPRHG